MEILELSFEDDAILPTNDTATLKRTSTKLLSKRKLSTNVGYEIQQGRQIKKDGDKGVVQYNKLREKCFISSQTIQYPREGEKRPVRNLNRHNVTFEMFDEIEDNNPSEYANSYSESFFKFARSPNKKCKSFFMKLTQMFLGKKFYNPNCKNGCRRCNCNVEQSVNGYINFQNSIYRCNLRK